MPPTRVTALGPASLLLGLAISIGGCAPSALSSAREQLAGGQYVEARKLLLGLKSQEANLSLPEKREVADDLCLADFMIGRPSISMAEQRRACAEASSQPNSQSGALLVRIDEQMRSEAIRRVEAALARKDLPAAQEAALEYRSTAGADPARITQWAGEMWKVVAEEETAHREGAGKHPPSAAIATLRKKYQATSKMDDAGFTQWIRTTATVGKSHLVARIDLKPGALKLWIAEDAMPVAALNLDRFTAINDAMAARCGCDARTGIGVAETGFPAYLLAFDPETRLSEVTIVRGGVLSAPPPPPQ
ncbi:MAG TPA: hypothetical protein VEC38_10830 [Candidatus Binataceae bacterium]|nr:hypothetical protein [Candidatus Binataceae bacterium]